MVDPQQPQQPPQAQQPVYNPLTNPYKWGNPLSPYTQNQNPGNPYRPLQDKPAVQIDPMKTFVDQTQDPQKRFDFVQQVNNRLGNISSIGDQQNGYVAQKSSQDFQTKLQNDLQAQYKGASQQAANPNTTSNNGFATSQNPRNAQEAIAWAKQAAASGDSQWYRRCLAFVAQAYGLPASGTNYAIDAYTRLGTDQRHNGDLNAPAGSLMFWDTGSRAGHVALYLGNGMIASNDINGKGKISIVPVSDISSRWGAKYMGWSDPRFAAGGQ